MEMDYPAAAGRNGDPGARPLARAPSGARRARRACGPPANSPLFRRGRQGYCPTALSGPAPDTYPCSPLPAATSTSDLAGARRVPPGVLVRVGASCGLAGGAFLVVHLATVAETAAAPTTNPGIRTSTWTPFTGLASLVSGPGALHGGFHPGWIVLGLALLGVASVVAGIVGLWWVYVCLGTAGPAWLGGLLGLAYGLFVEVVVFQFLVNPLQSPDVAYESAPPWAWWTGIAIFGGIVGLLGSRRLERLP